MNTEELLSKKGVKPSIHRIKVYDYILNKKNHPTVDTIFKELSGEIPTLSKTTVYNTLKIFQESGVIQAMTIEDNELRYDATVEKHAHFKCTECGLIYDVEMDVKALHLKTIGNHIVRECQLHFKGICESCQ